MNANNIVHFERIRQPIATWSVTNAWAEDCKPVRYLPQVLPSTKGALKCHWGSKILKRLLEKGRDSRSKKKRISPGQQQLPWD